METYDPSHGDVFNLRIGRFIRAFTFLEYWLYEELCHVAEVSPEIGKALFSGTKADGLSSFIRRCYEARGIPIDAPVERVLQHTTTLNTARNEVTHFRITSYYGGRDTVDNFHRTLPSRARTVDVDVDLLDAMTDDAVQAGVILMARHGRVKPSDLEGLDQPWRYKSPSQASPRRQDLDSAPKRQRPPKPSRE